jgi:hypothetical protein
VSPVKYEPGSYIPEGGTFTITLFGEMYEILILNAYCQFEEKLLLPHE